MRSAALAAAAVAIAAAGPALAEDRGSALDAPAPPTLPALAHASLRYTFEFTGAGIDPTRTGTATPALPLVDGARAYAWFLHNELEYPIVSRKWYVGGAHDVVTGAVPGVGHDLFLGSPELWTRALWSSLVGLSSGGGFGVVIPTPHTLEGGAGKIFQTVRVVRPWDAAYFTDVTLTLRPWLDVRHVVWRFIFQLRQGLDIAIVTRALKANERRADYVARTTFYTGFRLARPIGVGLEIWEVYQITADVGKPGDDSKRAAIALSPSIRFMLGRVEPALSLLFPIATPLRGEASSYFAARFNVGFDFDLGAPRGDSGS